MVYRSQTEHCVTSMRSARGLLSKVKDKLSSKPPITRCDGVWKIIVTPDHEKTAREGKPAYHVEKVACPTSQSCLNRGKGVLDCGVFIKAEYNIDEPERCGEDDNIEKVIRYTHKQDGNVHYGKANTAKKCPRDAPCSEVSGVPACVTLAAPALAPYRAPTPPGPHAIPSDLAHTQGVNLHAANARPILNWLDGIP